ncbi:glycosyltransferase family 1 protein [Georgenia faecalis]|uniref:glycosyltransferase family 1 protein n=1 Tax=Georgenia faecalis TaxID=2483799 RepID=UPI000FDCCEE5|nr:glycosyltransferase family 1 protein [Georgenia faecalis]
MPSRAKLLILSFSAIHADARVLRQVELFAGDYDVTTCGYGPAPEGVVEHVRIPDELVYWHKDRALLLQRRFAAVHRRNAVVDYLWDRLPRGYYDVVLADDIDTVPLALSLRPRGGVHADLHEYAPRQNEESIRWRLAVAPYVRWLVRTYVTRADSVTTVGPGIAEEYRREFGIDAQVVTNAAPYAEQRATPVAAPVRLVHSGNAMRGRGILELARAVEDVDADLTLDLYLVPNEESYLAEVSAFASQSSRVRLHAPVPYAELVTTLNAYDVGVHVLPPVSFNNYWALPNKVFDYVQARLGLLVGPSPEMARMVREHGLGEVTADFSAEAVSAALRRLTPERVAAYKEASERAAHELSAERQVAVWADAVAALAARAR